MNGVTRITMTEDIVLVTLRSKTTDNILIASIFDEFAHENIITDMIIIYNSISTCIIYTVISIFNFRFDMLTFLRLFPRKSF